MLRGMRQSQVDPAVAAYVDRLVQLTVSPDAPATTQLRTELGEWRTRTSGRTPEPEALQLIADAVAQPTEVPLLDRYAAVHFSEWRLQPLNRGLGWGFDVWRRQAAQILVALVRDGSVERLTACADNLQTYYPASPPRALHLFARAAAVRLQHGDRPGPAMQKASAPRISASTPRAGSDPTHLRARRSVEVTIRVHLDR